MIYRNVSKVTGKTLHLNREPGSHVWDNVPDCFKTYMPWDPTVLGSFIGFSEVFENKDVPIASLHEDLSLD